MNALRITRMTRTHLRICDEIAAQSEPWKTLNERIDFRRSIAQKTAYVCLQSDRPVGFVIFTPDPVFARGGYLRAIGVDPTLRRQGIGRSLLDFAEKRTAQRSEYLYLCASSFNRRAQSFYKKSGYARVGTLPDLIIPGASEYIYWKQLPRASHPTRRRNLDKDA
jgi:ribosomal protein S18 acetylase RimI-like enzyme